MAWVFGGDQKKEQGQGKGGWVFDGAGRSGDSRSLEERIRERQEEEERQEEQRLEKQRQEEQRKAEERREQETPAASFGTDAQAEDGEQREPYAPSRELQQLMQDPSAGLSAFGAASADISDSRTVKAKEEYERVANVESLGSGYDREAMQKAQQQAEAQRQTDEILAAARKKEEEEITRAISQLPEQQQVELYLDPNYTLTDSDKVHALELIESYRNQGLDESKSTAEQLQALQKKAKGSALGYILEKTAAGVGITLEGMQNYIVDTVQKIPGWIRDAGEFAKTEEQLQQALNSGLDIGTQEGSAEMSRIIDEGLSQSGFNEEFEDPLEERMSALDDLKSHTRGEQAALVDSRYNNPAGGVKLAGEVGGAIGALLPGLLLNMFTGGGGMAVMFASAAGNAIDEAKSEGADDTTAYIYGLLSGATEVATEKVTGGIPGLGVGGGDDLVRGMLKKAAASPATQQVVMKAADILGEGVEEYLSEVVGAYLEKLYKEDDRGAWQTFVETQPDALASFLLGSLTSGVMNVGEIPGIIGNVNTERALQSGEPVTVRQAQNYENLVNDLYKPGTQEWQQAMDRALENASPATRAGMRQLAMDQYNAQAAPDQLGSEEWYRMQMQQYRDGLVSPLPVAQRNAETPQGAMSLPIVGTEDIGQEIKAQEEKSVTTADGNQSTITEIKKKVSEYVNKVIQKKGALDKTEIKMPIWKVPENIIQRVNESSQGRLNLEGRHFVFNAYEIWHEYKQHSGKERAASQGQIPLTAESIVDVLDVLSDPDYVEFRQMPNNKNLNTYSFILAKKIDGHMVVTETTGGAKSKEVTTKAIWNFTNEMWNKYLESGLSLSDFIDKTAGKKKTGGISATIDAPERTPLHTPEASSHTITPVLNDSLSQGETKINEGASQSGEVEQPVPLPVAQQTAETPQRTIPLPIAGEELGGGTSIQGDASRQARQRAIETGTASEELLGYTERMVRRSGRRLEYVFEPDSPVGGSVDDTKITINLANPDYAFNTAVHEVGHTMKSGNSRQWASFEQAMLRLADSSPEMEAIARGVADAYIGENSRGLRSMQAEDGSLNEAALAEEISLKLAEEIVKDPARITQAVEQDRGMIQRLLDFVRGLKNQAMIRFGKNESAMLDEAERTLVNLLRGQAGSVPAERYEIQSRLSDTVGLAQDLTYESLVAKPDMKVTQIDDSKTYKGTKEERRQVLQNAKNNAAAVGKQNSDGSISVYAADLGENVILSTRGLIHGLDRRLNENAAVTERAGEILQNAILINKLVPKDPDLKDCFVMLGAAQNQGGDLSLVEFVIKQHSNELRQVNVLYSLNNKKGDPAARSAWGLESPTTGPTISIADLLDIASETFPDILPESVLRQYGFDTRPEGAQSKYVLFGLNTTPNTESNLPWREYARQRYADLQSRMGGAQTAAIPLPVAQQTAETPQGAMPLPIAGEQTAKSRQYQTRAENRFVNEIGEALSVPGTARRGVLKPAAQQLTQEIRETGRVNAETANAVFDEVYRQGRIVLDEVYNQYKDLKAELRREPITLAQVDRNSQTYQEFRQSNFGVLNLVNEGGVPVDVKYQDLAERWPELFPADVTNPADQLEKMAEVARSIVKTEADLDTYYGDDPFWRDAARESFDRSLEKLQDEMGVVTRYDAEQAQKQRAKRTSAPPSVEQMQAVYRTAQQLQKKADRVVRNTLLTDSDNKTVEGLLRGKISPEQVVGANSRDILRVYEAKKAVRDVMEPIRQYKADRHEERLSTAQEFIENSVKWKDKKIGYAYNTETMERNLRDIAGNDAKGLIDYYFTPVHKDVAALTRWKNQMRNRVRSLKLNHAESAYLQMYGELQGVEAARQMGLERSDGEIENLREQEAKYYERHKDKIDKVKVERALKVFRGIYDEAIARMNRVYVENGYAPVEYRQGYFPHFNENKPTGWLGRIAGYFGISTGGDTLPTDIDGLTHTFKPGRKFNQFGLQRTGYQTEYDALKGLDKYLETAADVIFLTDDIQNLRALESAIRMRYSEKGVQERIREIQRNEDFTEAEKDSALEEYRKKSLGHLNGFVRELTNYTNLLAGKKSAADRGIEGDLGRGIYQTMNNIERRVAANMVAANPASWMTNFIPIVQAAAEVSPKSIVRAAKDTAKNWAKNDGFEDRSTFLTNRAGSAPASRTKKLQKLSEWMGKPMEWIDMFTANVVTRAKYYENIRGERMTPDAAMDDADSFAASIMADRSKGALPTIFARKSPLWKAVTMFQVEVNNQLRHYFKDLPQAHRDEALKVIAQVLLKYFIGAYLYNDLYEYFIGRRPAMDAIGLLNETVGNLSGYQLPNLIEAVEDLASGESPDFTTQRKGAIQAVSMLGEGVAEQLPFVGGMLGGGRIPVTSVIPDPRAVVSAVTGLGSGEIAPNKAGSVILDELEKPFYYLLPPFGGGQGKKLVEGVSAVMRGGVYGINNDGEETLRFPIEDQSLGTYLQAGFFGPYALPTGQEYAQSGFKSKSVSWTQEWEAAKEQGIGFDQFEEWKELASEVRADKNEKGNSIPGTKAKNLRQLLNDPRFDFTPTQREFLMQQAGYDYYTLEKVEK